MTRKAITAQNLTPLQARILTMIQQDFPVESHPYRIIGEACGVDEDQAFGSVRVLCDQGIIRRVGATFDSSRLGYVSTLSALAAPEDDIERMADIVSTYTEVTHNYQRDNRFNIWFTTIAPSEDRLEQILSEIVEKTGCADLINLPIQRYYKLRVNFDLTGEHAGTAGGGSSHGTPGPGGAPVPLTERDKMIIRFLNGDISPQIEPYAWLATVLTEVGFPTSEHEVIDRIKFLRDEGAIRRVGVLVRHHSVGVKANAMTVWNIPDGEIDQAGAILAESPNVTHCYCRARGPRWPHNLYAMVHASSKDLCREIAQDLHEQLVGAGVHAEPPLQLFSTREFAKRSPKYFF